MTEGWRAHRRGQRCGLRVLGFTLVHGGMKAHTHGSVGFCTLILAVVTMVLVWLATSPTNAVCLAMLVAASPRSPHGPWHSTCLDN